MKIDRRRNDTREKVRSMHFERGLSQREIATLLGISTQAVWQQVKKIEAESPVEEEQRA